MKEGKVTPTPWTASGAYVNDAKGNPIVWGVDDWGYERGEAEGCANAEFIVRAVNAHEELVAALNTILALICDKPLCGHFTAEEIRGVAERALSRLSPDPQKQEGK